MNKTWLFARTEVRNSLGRKTFVLFAFGLPILMGIVALGFALINQGDGESETADILVESSEPSDVGYVDPGHQIQSLPENVPTDWLKPYPDQEAAMRALEDGEIRGFYLIPEDYVAAGELTLVKLTYNPLNPEPTETFQWILLYNMAGEDQALATSLWQPLDLTLTSIAPPSEDSGEETWINELLPTVMTLILYMVIIMTSSILINAISDEKKNRVMEIVLSSASSNQFISGKIIAGGILGLMMIFTWLGLFWLVSTFGGASLNIPADFVLPTNLLAWAVVYAFLGYAMYGSLMAGLGALSPDVKDARGLTMMILLPLIFGYMLNIFIQINPDGPIAVIASLFPLTAPVTMIIRMTVTEVPVWQAALAAVFMVATAVLIIRLVAQFFRAQILLSGQQPTVKRYFQTLLGRAT
jgi:ABC-2 type transport system permease protein